MNIKEHIEAGHYPKDEKGRALVPMRDGRVATVVAMDAPGEMPIVALHAEEREETSCSIFWPSGRCVSEMSESRCYDLLPPPPRKVNVARWGLIANNGLFMSTWPTQLAAKREADQCQAGALIVELTGEYEEPWA